MEQAVNGSSPPVIRFRKQSGRRRDGLWQDTRTPGKPVWCIRYKGLDGKYHRERTEARTREQALALLHQRTSEILRARIVGAHSLEALKPMSFEDFIEREYLPHCKATHTTKTYRGDQGFSRAVAPTFGKMPLRAISSGDIQRFVDQRAHRVIRYEESEKSKKTPIFAKPATTNRELMFISGAMSEALRRGYVDRNPATGIPQLPEHNDKLRWLTNEEEKRLLTTCPVYLRPIVRCALLTGMRQGELLELKWADVDFEQRIVKIARAKNHKTRYIPMSKALKELLGPLKPESPNWEASPYVFMNPETEDKYVDVGHAFGRVADKAGLTDVTFHTLRHTFASRLAQVGVPLNTIRELLGHGTMVMTMRYAHLSPNNLREAVEMLAMGSSAEGMRTRDVQNATPILRAK